jgi:enterochelin esterase-like enzyme
VRDPLNRHLANDPFGANSVIHAAGYEEPDWVDEDEQARPGEIQTRSIESKVFGDTREIQVYLPARFRRTRRYPLLIVHDGADYVRFAALKTVLDNLVHRHEIASPIVVMTSSPNRMQEYAGDPRHGDYIVKDVLPVIEREFPLVVDASARCLMGASFGAVASLATAWRHPGIFGKLLLQSGSFVFTDIGPHDKPSVFDPVVDFVNEFRESPGTLPPEVYLSCGTYESLITYNRAMVPFLRDHGVTVNFTEARDGHNWENWRDRLREGLTWLLPGPLWLVYE